MPPKITDSRPAPDAVLEMEEQTAAGARRIVATYAEDFFDGVTLMAMLGVEPTGFVYKRYAEQLEAEAAEAEAAKPAKKTTKKAAKKAAKKSAKKTTKKTTKKTAKKAAKKATKKTTKKTVKKAAKKAAKKTPTTE